MDGDDPPPFAAAPGQYEASDILRAAGADVPEEPARKTVKKKKKVVKRKVKRPPKMIQTETAASARAGASWLLEGRA